MKLDDIMLLLGKLNSIKESMKSLSYIERNYPAVSGIDDLLTKLGNEADKLIIEEANKIEDQND